MNKRISLIVICIFATLYVAYSQNSTEILKTATEDSLGFYVEQQIKRLNEHSEYHIDSIVKAGLNVYGRGELDYARQFFEMAYNRYEQNGDKQNMARFNSNIAVIHEMEGRYDKALERYHKSLKIMEGLKDSLPDYEIKTVQRIILGNVGVLYNEMKEFDKSYPYFVKSTQINYEIIEFCQDSAEVPKYKKEIKISKDNIAGNYNNIAYYWENKSDKNLDSALLYYKKAYEIQKSLQSPEQHHILSNIGIVYAQQNNFKKALPLLEECYNQAFEGNNEIILSGVYHSLAYVYIATKQYAKAHKILDEGLQYCRKHNMLNDELQLVQLLYDLQKKEGKYKDATTTSETLIALNDSLLSQQKNEAIAKNEVIYETERKEYEAKLAKEELQVKEAELNSQRVIFILIALAVLFVAIVIAFFVWRARIQEKQKKLILESKLFRSQINPHFMFNALGAIQAYMIDHSNDESMVYLLSFSSLMRNILDSSRTDEITIEKEEAIIKDYLELQKLRFDNRFNYNIEVDKNIDKERVSLPPMLLQPFVENAVEHGVKSLDKNKIGQIDVSFVKKDKQIQISVKDNGKGIKSNENNKKKHISHATNITNERIQTINKLTKYKVGMDIKSVEDKGTEVLIVVGQH